MTICVPVDAENLEPPTDVSATYMCLTDVEAALAAVQKESWPTHALTIAPVYAGAMEGTYVGHDSGAAIYVSRMLHMYPHATT